VINVTAANSYVGAAGARLPLSAAAPTAGWPLSDAVRPHVMAKQLKRTTDVFPSSTRGMDPPV
jgi:hypothetical protein